jgi:hypothetical protein
VFLLTRTYFLLNFLLALTEQTNIYPFISNLSISSESSILESFPANSYLEFISIHGCYILGLTLGSLSLLHLTCWFWENPAFKLYMWVIGLILGLWLIISFWHIFLVVLLVMIFGGFILAILEGITS